MLRLAVASLIALLPAVASAHGAFPLSRSVSFQRGNPERILYGTNFGLFISEDGGDTFRFTCEKNVGFDGGNWDPVFVATRSGKLFASTFAGLTFSTDGGCNWSVVGAPVGPTWISDLFLSPADDALWTVTGLGGATNHVLVSRDDGASFTATSLLVDRAIWRSVRVAPDRAQRVYVSGFQLPDPAADPDAGVPLVSLPLLFASDDGGATWSQLPFAFEAEAEVFLVAVAPGTSGDTLFARVNGRDKDTLLRSSDGGQSFTPVLTLGGDVLDMAVELLADGQHMIAGTDVAGGWARVSSDAGLTWSEPAMQPEMGCVNQAIEGGDVFACGDNWDDGFALGRSANAGQNWDKVVRFIEFDGELECPADSIHAVRCAGEWQSWATMFGIGRADAGPPPVSIDASPEPEPEPERKPDCGGCGVALGVLLFASPWRRRRRL